MIKLLKQLYKLNRTFFLSYLFILVPATGLLFFMEKGDLVLYFSQNRSEFADGFFRVLTVFGDGILFVVFGLLLFLVKNRYALGMGLLGLSVMLVSFLSKSIFASDRPLPYFQKIGIEDQLTFVAGVEVHTGATSFPSGHTIAAFAMYAFLAFLSPEKKSTPVLLLLLAVGVGVSRVYLVQHFLPDIYLGSIIGLGLAWIMAVVQKGWNGPWMDRRLSFFKSQL